MLDGFRELARFFVGALVSFWGIGLLFGLAIAVIGGVDVLAHGDIDSFLRHLLLLVVVAAVIGAAVWIHHDAKSELKNIQVQKQEIKNREGATAAPPDVSTREPWLFP